jgi:hypothetical protein
VALCWGADAVPFIGCRWEQDRKASREDADGSNGDRSALSASADDEVGAGSEDLSSAAWSLREASFYVVALEEVLTKYGKPEIVNTDQGAQFGGEMFADIHINRYQNQQPSRCEQRWRTAPSRHMGASIAHPRSRDYVGVGYSLAFTFHFRHG